MTTPRLEVFTFYSATTGLPLSGLVPTFTTYVKDEGTAVSQPTISAVLSGGYKFTPTFAGDPTRGIYYEVVPNNASAVPAAYSRLMRPEDWVDSLIGDPTDASPTATLFGKIDAVNIETDPSALANAVWNELISSHQTAGTMGLFLNDLFRLLRNKAIINPTSKQLEIYDDPGTSIIFTMDLKDDVGVASVTKIFQRIPQPLPAQVIEAAAGSIDGTNKSFTVSSMYVPGSLQVWLNGLLLRKDYDSGWTEQGSNKFKMKEAPVAGDVVQAYYRPL